MNWPAIHAALVRCGQGSQNSQAAAIATTAIETASTFAPVREAYYLFTATEEMNGTADAWRKRNLRYWPYYGRSYIQLTWDYNYRAAGQAIGVDLLSNPDLAMDPAYAADIFAWYWAGRNIQAMADRRDWRAVRAAVQGADAGLSRLIQICEALV